MSQPKGDQGDLNHSANDSKDSEDDNADSSNDGETDVKRHHKRIMANRRSARASRERRKKLLTDLQEQVNKLRVEAQELLSENRSLRAQLVSSGGLPVTTPPGQMDGTASNSGGINQSLAVGAVIPPALQQPSAVASSSPYAALSLNQMQSRAALTNQLNSQLNSQLTNQLNAQLTNQLNSQMSNQMSSQMSNQLNNQMSSQMSNQMNNQLSTQMNQLDLQRLLQSTMAARGLTNEDIIALIRRQHGL